MTIEFCLADYNNPIHANDVVVLLDAYASDPMGGNQSLNQEVKQRLIERLRALPYAYSFIGYQCEGNGEKKPVALANCFMGFSTFRARPLLNIHDCYVAEGLRGQHVGQQLLQSIESFARQHGCCKITLEVLEGNKRAQNAYEKFGFSGYALYDTSGNALFWEKALK
jgi:ribosomal protein S18 acetylase RimI-like enzyme